MKKTVLGLAALVAACMEQTGGGGPKLGGEADTCGAAAYAHLVGQDAIATLPVPEPKRSYREGDPVTMDFNAARINFLLDDADVILSVSCG